MGLNYDDHASETGNAKPDFPVIFGRFAFNLIGHGGSIVRPDLSHTLDYEGELVAIIGSSARKVSVDNALSHVIAYSVFNDGSIREYQRKNTTVDARQELRCHGGIRPVARHRR